ncbi:hypothetical protein KDN32_12165 [Nocardioides sp. J2M5]|uniref:SAF domain-containing protein n=1 Tax=Nocardioides palaemonis TaxID=2829810 RepID=UPI001BA7ADE0|nr:SAF domain-containing protein [Nocardioides palaemonis]MBS2938499.1 hypothetical protein [Nocardioides palaemonis]
MTHMTMRDDRTSGTSPAPAAPPLRPPPRLRRRPALIAGAVVSICLGALLAAWAWSSTTNTQEVLTARATIPRGAVITSDDLARVRISTDPALAPLPASAYDDLLGQHAALDIAEGGLLTAASVTTEPVPPEGMSVVGVALTPAQSPSMELRNGDRVRVVVTPGEGGEPSAGAPVFSDAEVVGSRTDDLTGDLLVDLMVPSSEATVLATRVSTANVALVLDSGAQ